MSRDADKSWWAFSVDYAMRAGSGGTRLGGALDVDQRLPDGQLGLDYAAHLMLGTLLQSQAPVSLVPDERVFVITHQLIELVFKLVILDFAIIAETLSRSAQILDRDQALLNLADEPFWRPALTASARILFSSKDVLPLIMRYLDNDAAETFSGIEFALFREHLAPASGFQSAQFRLIERAFGKAPLLSLRLFPGASYQSHYRGAEDGAGLVSVIDELVLLDHTVVANPTGDSPLIRVARFDELAHQALGHFALFEPTARPATALPHICQSDIDRAVKGLYKLLRDLHGEAGGVDAFQRDLAEVARVENARRDALAAARVGVGYIRRVAPDSHLLRVLDRLVRADQAFYGNQRDSVLGVHMRVAKNRLREVDRYIATIGAEQAPRGTGGGGIAYLGYVRKFLLPLFPTLIAYQHFSNDASDGHVV